jgi:hypothetical protein
VWEFAREDFTLYDPPENAFDPREADYVIVTTRANADLPFHLGADEIDRIQSDEATFSFVLKQVGVD